MKRIASMLIGALFVGACFGIALAQEGAPPPAPHAAPPAAAAPAAPPAAAPAPAATEDHSDEVAALHRMIRMHHRMWKRLKQNPNLVSDDAFVGKYLDFTVYLPNTHDSE